MIRHKPLLPGTKRMKRRHRACGAPTKAQQAHQDAQRRDGCAMCHLLGLSFKGLPEGVSPCGVSEIHHCTTGDLHGQKQRGQGDTVCLGSYHHRGLLLSRFPTVAGMHEQFGPSLHHHKRAFLEVIAEKLGERSTAALQRHQEERL